MSVSSAVAFLPPPRTQKFPELRRRISIIGIDAGARLFDFANQVARRQRMMEYGKNACPGDAIAVQWADGIISRTMTVGCRMGPLPPPASATASGAHTITKV